MEIVSVIVFCYNSSNTVLETLNSIYNQTYKNINLIISDDCSKDNTVDVVIHWVLRHSERFNNAIVIKNEKNVGTSAHMNLRINEVRTKWIKTIAGDDILLPDCIENDLHYAEKNNLNGILISYMCPFHDDGVKRQYTLDFDEIAYINKVANADASAQYKMLLQRDVLCSPTIFFNRDFYTLIGGCNESYKNIEDWPLKIKAARKGYRLVLMKRFTVLYRMGTSISRSENQMFNNEFINKFKELKISECYPNIPKTNINYYYKEFITDLRFKTVIKMGNKRDMKTKVVNYSLALLNPDKFRKSIVNTINRKKTAQMLSKLKIKYNL